MNYYERHIGDYLKDTSHLSLLEHGIYARLLDVYYTREGAIPVAQVERLVGAKSKEERAALGVVLDEFFQADGDMLKQCRCDLEIARYQDKQRKAKASADSRWSHTGRIPNAMRTHSEGNALQTPDTRHQEENPPAARVPPDASPRPTKKCPADYAVPEAVRAWAREHVPRLDVDEQAAAMRDHTFATARKDWDGTLRNWLRKADASRSSVKPFQTAKERDRLAAEARVREMTGGLLDRAFPRGDVIEMEVAHAAQIGSR